MILAVCQNQHDNFHKIFAARQNVKDTLRKDVSEKLLQPISIRAYISRILTIVRQNLQKKFSQGFWM